MTTVLLLYSRTPSGAENVVLAVALVFVVVAWVAVARRVSCTYCQLPER